MNILDWLNPRRYIELKPNKEHAYDPTSNSAVIAQWDYTGNGGDDKLSVTSYQVKTRLRVNNLSIENKRQNDLKYLLGISNIDQSVNIMNYLSINNWEDFFQFVGERIDQLQSFPKPIYNHQYEFIVDLLHYIFMVDRSFNPNFPFNQHYKICIPSYFISTNSNEFRDNFKSNIMVTNYNAIARNQLLTIIFTKQELDYIYGKLYLNPYVPEEKLTKLSIERFKLAYLFHDKIEKEEALIREEIDFIPLEEYYEDNTELIALINSGTYMLENRFIEKKFFIIEKRCSK